MLVIDQELAAIDLGIDDLRVEEPPPVLVENLCCPIPKTNLKRLARLDPLAIYSPRNQRMTADIFLKDRIYSSAKNDTSTIISKSSIYSSPQLEFDIYFNP